MTLYSEITEQPERIKSLLGLQKRAVEKITSEIQKRNIQYVFFAAHDTSDNAGRYANYLLDAMNRLWLALATLSLFTYYNQPPTLKNALVIGISQSGQSPDIVSALDWMSDSDKVHVSDHENLQFALLGVFDSQIAGGKRYDLASMGRRRANATYFESHGVDATTGLSYAMDMSPLLSDATKDPVVFAQDFIQRFAQDVNDRIRRMS